MTNNNPVPLQVIVGDIPYTIEKKDRITTEEGKNLDGQITYNTATIEIVEGMPIQVERFIVWHEIAHACFEAAGHNAYRMDEDLVDCVAHKIVEVLRANPQLVAYTVS